VLPSGAAQLIVNLAEDQTRVYESTPRGLVCRTTCGSVLSGLDTRFTVIDTAEQEHVAGVVFRPGGTLAFLAMPASELSGLDATLESVCDAASARRLRERLLASPNPDVALGVLESWLNETYRNRSCHPAVAFAVSEFHAQPSLARIEAVKDVLSLSPKRFIERFKAEIGVTPKRYCRLLRFQQAVAKTHCAKEVDWAELALSCGYFDQAHFIHEFREFSGLTPSGYRSNITAFQNHVTFLQYP
jgi:AraC-like DNA-binding protein